MKILMDVLQMLFYSCIILYTVRMFFFTNSMASAVKTAKEMMQPAADQFLKSEVEKFVEGIPDSPFSPISSLAVNFVVKDIHRQMYLHQAYLHNKQINFTHDFLKAAVFNSPVNAELVILDIKQMDVAANWAGQMTNETERFFTIEKVY